MIRTMVKFFKACRSTLVLLSALALGGCVSYNITESDMTQYLQDNVSLEQSVGVQNVMYARVSVEDINVKIGREEAERISVFASTNALVQVLSAPNMGLDLDIEFSAIPEYNQETGEVFLKSLRLEKLEEHSQSLTPEVKTLLKPAVAMIGQALSQHPVYKLDGAKVQEALIKTAEPNLVIRNNQLVIELFD